MNKLKIKRCNGLLKVTATDMKTIEIVRKALEGWREDESEGGVLQAGDTVLYQTVFVKVVQ